MRKSRVKSFHARYDPREKAFVCLICEKNGFRQWVYDGWEIPRHLKKVHKVCRKNQYVSGWNQTFENEYSRNRKKPLKFFPDEDSIAIDETPNKELQEDKKRIEEELKAKRDPR